MRHRLKLALTLAAYAMGAMGGPLLGGCALHAQQPVLLALPHEVSAPASVASAAPAASGAQLARVATSAGTSAPVLIVRRAAVPEYLQSRAVRYRGDGVHLASWPGVVWAERLEVALTRALAEDLRLRLPGWRVCDTDCPGGGAELAGALTLHVEFSRLDYYASSGRLDVQAQWRFSDLTIAPQTLDTTLPSPGADLKQPASQALALAAAVHALGGVLAERLNGWTSPH